MGLNITVYNYSKPRNSFSVPTWEDNGVWKTVATLKEPATLTQPILKFTGLLSGIPMDNTGKSYNYAFIEEFRRYYFIEEWTALHGGLWEARLSVDPLASFKTEILSTTQYLLRSPNGSRFTDYLTDTLYPILNQSETAIEEYKLLDVGGAWTRDLTKGCFILSIVSPSPSESFGSTTLYCFTPTQMTEFCDFLYGSTDWLNVDVAEISDSLSRMLFNPIQYIASAMYFPMDAGWFGGKAVESVNLGWWTIEKSCKVLTERTLLGGSVPLAVPKHPQSTFGKYMNCEPYTNYTFYFPGVGSFPIESRLIVDLNQILFSFDIDIATGEIRVIVHRSGATALDNIATAVGQIGIPVQLSQIRSNENGVFAGVAKAVSSKIFNTFPALDIGGKISNVTNGILSAVETANSSTTSIGSTGGLLNLTYNPHIRAVFRKRADEDVSRFGKACCSEFSLSALEGYVQTLDCKFSNLGRALPSEIDMVCNLLDGGVYIE